MESARSAIWRQYHNGFSHQDPGFLDHVVNEKAEVVRMHLPPDANTLLSVTDHYLRSRNYVNVIVAGKQPAPQWLPLDAAVEHCKAGLGVWEWAPDPVAPDVVMARCGDVPTLETLAAVEMVREHLPGLRVRVVNVVDLMTLQPDTEHPHGLTDRAFDAVFPADTPTVFAFHGYPWLIHRLTYRRAHHRNLHVRGDKEEGTTTTPFDMCVRNDIDRFPQLRDVARWVTGVAADRRAAVDAWADRKRAEHARYIREHGEDMPEVASGRPAAARPRATTCEPGG
jgi:xylulose-5-phosphate/fructose-6-phosphate phosphoketolase